MVFSLDHISGSPSTSTTSTLAPSLTSSTLELRLVGHCPVGGGMRHQQLVARNLGGEVADVADGAELGARRALLHVGPTLVALGKHCAKTGDWTETSVTTWT